MSENHSVTGWKVRRETDPAVVSSISGDQLVVSPDGKSIAFWAPPGGREELRIVPAAGGEERTVLTLPATERGQGIAWSTDGSGLAIGIDAKEIPMGGIDPPPAYSAVRTIDLRTNVVREVMRWDLTRLRAIGWIPDRQVVLVAQFGGMGRILSYMGVDSQGIIVRSEFDLSGEGGCNHATSIRLNSAGTHVLSVNPQRCFDGTSPGFTGSSVFRVWMVDQTPDAAREFDLGRVFLLDALFQPGSAEAIAVTRSGDTVLIRASQGDGLIEVAELTPANPQNIQGQFPLFFRHGAPVLLVPWASESTGSAARGTLLNIENGTSVEVDLADGRPSGSVVLRP